MVSPSRKFKNKENYLLETKLSPDMNYKFTLSAKVNSLNETDKEASGAKYLSNEEKLDNIMEAYTSLYEEIDKESSKSGASKMRALR